MRDQRGQDARTVAGVIDGAGHCQSRVQDANLVVLRQVRRQSGQRFNLVAWVVYFARGL